MDIKVINKKDKIKFEYFSSIRNQFAHNREAINFKTCFDFIDMHPKLSKYYGAKVKNEKDAETQSQILFYELYMDLVNITIKFRDAMSIKYQNIEKIKSDEIVKNALYETISEFKKGSIKGNATIDDFINSFIKKANDKIG